MKRLFFVCGLIGCLVLLSQCKKNCGCVPPNTSTYKLSYSDSVFYLKNNDYTVTPLTKGTGTYTVFPDNLRIDHSTGAVTVTPKGVDGESQTGMWYKIKFRSTDGSQIDSTLLLISGLTYVDRIYNLAQNDSIIYPIYNGDPSKAVPQGNYDLTADNKFAVNAVNGQINIKECLRRGFFNSGVMGSGWKVATVKYFINDASQQATNQIDLVIYYYNSVSEIPSNVSALMQAHQQQTVNLRALPTIPNTNGPFETNLPSDLSLSKPRPPCLIIIPH